MLNHATKLVKQYYYSTTTKTIFISSMFLLGMNTNLAQQNQASSYFYSTKNVHIAVEKANIYIENSDAATTANSFYFNGSNLYFKGDIIGLKWANWTIGSLPSHFYFIASPDVVERINKVTISKPNSSIPLPNVTLLIPSYSSNSNIVLNELIHQELKITNAINYPNDNLLILGQNVKPVPVLSDTANKMKLFLVGENTEINDNLYNKSNYILTPGRSSLVRFVAANSEIPVIFPVGDNINSLAPVGISETSRDNYFQVAASEFLYDWDRTFISNEEQQNPTVNRRGDYVKKNWIIKNQLPNSITMNARIFLQHEDLIEVQAQDYDPEKTIISRYIGDKTTVLARNDQLTNEISTPSYSYWENTLFKSKLLKNQIGNLDNIISSTAFTHVTNIADFSNQYPIYVKAGLAEDSTPLGGKMRVPVWISLTGNHGNSDPSFAAPDAITFNVYAAQAYRIEHYDLYVTNSRDVAQAGFINSPSNTYIKKTINTNSGIEDPNASFDQGNFTDIYTTTDTMFFRIFPVGTLPSDNITVEYINSPIGIIPPNSNSVDKLIVMGNPAQIGGTDPLTVLLPKDLSPNIKDGKSYIIEPVSKNHIYVTPLSKLGASYGFQVMTTEKVMVSGVYTIVIVANMKDGTKKQFTTKMVVQ